MRRIALKRMRRPAKKERGGVFRIGHSGPEAVIARRRFGWTRHGKSFDFNHGQGHSLWHGNCNSLV